MMLKGKSNPWRKLRFIGILPLAVVAVATFARPEVSNEFEKLSAVKITEIIPEVKKAVAQTVQKTDTVQVKIENVSVNVDDVSVHEVSIDHVFVNEISVDNINVNIDSIRTKIEKVSVEIADTPEINKLNEVVNNIPKSVVFVVDGKIMNPEDVNKIAPEMIKRVEVIKETKAANAGTVLITTLNENVLKLKTHGNLQDASDEFYKKLNVLLIIVDGELYEEPLSNIPPERIATVSVLKNGELLDEYAEKYGTKAKNGVVIIELKKQ